MNRITLLNLIKNGGATLNARGESVNFSRGYQVSKKDCYILEVGAVNKILKAVNKLLSGLQSCDFVGLWVENGLIYIDISERIERLSAAMVAGIARGQKSIFDWCMGRCIGLGVSR